MSNIIRKPRQRRETVFIEPEHTTPVYVGKNHVGDVRVYERHCDAVPSDPQGDSCVFMSEAIATRWLRMTVLDPEEAEDITTLHGVWGRTVR